MRPVSLEGMSDEDRTALGVSASACVESNVKAINAVALSGILLLRSESLIAGRAAVAMIRYPTVEHPAAVIVPI
jgi:hypothetical protein